MSSVILATTMWADVSPANGSAREAELKNTGEFWGDMIRAGSVVYRHTDDYNSAIRIISHILGKQSTTVLELQRELVDERISLGNTKAGREVARDILKKKESYELKFKQMKAEMEEALAQRDKELAEEIAKEQEAFHAKIDAAEQDRKDLQVQMKELIREREILYVGDLAKLVKKIERALVFAQKREQEFEKQQLPIQGKSDGEIAGQGGVEITEIREKNLEQLRLLQGCLSTLAEQRIEWEEQMPSLRQARDEMVRTLALQRQIDRTLYEAAGGAISGLIGIGLSTVAMVSACVVM